MRIAVVIERFASGAGGVESAAAQLVAELARRAVDLTVVCREARDPAPPGVDVRELGGPRAWQPLRIAAFSRSAAAATRGHFDVVHSYSRTRHQDIYRAGGGCHADFLERMYAHPTLQRLSPRHRTILNIEEAVLHDERQIIQCNSHHIAAQLKTRYALAPSRLRVIYNGVDIERFHPRTRGDAGRLLRGELGLTGPVAAFVGTGFARKGLDRAIDGLAEAGVDADLIVAGRDDPAPWRARAASRGLEKRVHFLGERADSEAVYAASDLFVLPTRYDAFSNTVLEAMASGVAVATSTTNGAAEAIGDDCGYVLEDFAPAFAALADPSALRDLGAAARLRAEAFTWTAHADRVLELYAEIAR